MKFIDRVNIEEDFWVLNNEIKHLSPFSNLVDLENSSRIMWAIYLVTDPNSKFARLPQELKEEEIINNYLKIDNFKFSDYEEYIIAYKELLLTKTQRLYIEWENKLEERNKFIAEYKYDIDTFEMLDKMMASTSKMWEQYFKIKDQMIEEENKSQLKGGRKESKSERGEI